MVLHTRSKQCGGFGKNGKFNPQAAIRQVKFSPVAVANIALQAAAVAVGQAYMTEISSRLNEIEGGISKIQREMERERSSKIEASFRMLRDYIEHYAEYSERPEKNQAVQCALEDIKRDALAAWSFQIRSLSDLSAQVRRSGKLDSAGVSNYLNALESCDISSSAIYSVLMMEEQAQIQYASSYDRNRLREARHESDRYLREYESARSAVQESLREKISGLRGKLLVVPRPESDRFKTSSPAMGAYCGAKGFIRSHLPSIMRAEAKRSLSSQKRSLSAAASTANPLVELAERRQVELMLQDDVFNRAIALAIDEDRVRLLIPKHEAASEGSI